MERKTYRILKKASLALAIVGVSAEIGLGIAGSVISGQAAKEMNTLDPLLNVQEIKQAEDKYALRWRLIAGAAAGGLTSAACWYGTYAFWCKENGWKVRKSSKEMEEERPMEK